MHCHLLRFLHLIVLWWIVGTLRAQPMSDQQSHGSHDHGSSYFFYQLPEYPRDCEEVRDQCSSATLNSAYVIRPDGYPEPFEVYCESVGSEVWTILLRRINGFVDFNRPWNEYHAGFGFLSQDFWIGTEKLSYLTNQKNYELRIDMTYSDGTSCHADYNLFRIGDGFGKFKIVSLGIFSGNADDCLPLCPDNMEPGDCSCQRACNNPSGCVDTCDAHEMCVCSSGFYPEGNKCLPLDECTRSGCIVDGVLISDGEFYVNPDCTRRADCSNGQTTWNDAYVCTSDQICDERDSIRNCYNSVTDCLDIYNDGFTDSGIYKIAPSNWPGLPFEVYCNMTDGGGWTVFQRRVDGTIDFYRNWTSYKKGFGSPVHEFWLGNDKIFFLTNQKPYSLRIDLVNNDGSPYFAKFDAFRIENETDNYRLAEVGTYSGTAGSGIGLSGHRNYLFSTYDRDNDVSDRNVCAVNHHGAWWYGSCANSNLNGDYNETSNINRGITWLYLPGSSFFIKFTEMKLRPL